MRDVLRGKAQPNRITFVLWSLAPFVATAASLEAGVTWAVWPTFMAGLGPFLVLCATFFSSKAYWKVSSFDLLCLGVSLLSLVLWQLTNDPVIAVLFALFSNAMAALPTIVKSWSHPETETRWIFLGGLVTPILGLAVANTMTFEAVAFPLYLILCNFTLVILPLCRKRAALSLQ